VRQAYNHWNLFLTHQALALGMSSGVKNQVTGILEDGGSIPSFGFGPEMDCLMRNSSIKPVAGEWHAIRETYYDACHLQSESYSTSMF